jgi:tetratricopeptide (TPR) repeat protein
LLPHLYRFHFFFFHVVTFQALIVAVMPVEAQVAQALQARSRAPPDPKGIYGTPDEARPISRLIVPPASHLSDELRKEIDLCREQLQDIHVHHRADALIRVCYEQDFQSSDLRKANEAEAARLRTQLANLLFRAGDYAQSFQEFQAAYKSVRDRVFDKKCAAPVARIGFFLLPDSIAAAADPVAELLFKAGEAALRSENRSGALEYFSKCLDLCLRYEVSAPSAGRVPCGCAAMR